MDVGTSISNDDDGSVPITKCFITLSEGGGAPDAKLNYRRGANEVLAPLDERAQFKLFQEK